MRKMGKKFTVCIREEYLLFIDDNATKNTIFPPKF